jgi:diguanylate cyclase (GGDEF)-like protein
MSNPSYFKKFGYGSADELLSQPLLDMVDTENQGAIKQLLRSASQGENIPASLSIKMKSVRGEILPVELELSTEEYEGESCISLMIREPMAEPQQADNLLLDRLSTLEHHDLLTNLYNRPYFLEQLQMAIDDYQENSEHKALLYIDLDAFQDIRERHGIGAADHILISISDLLRATLGDVQIPSRYDGNIFTAIIDNVDEEAAAQYAEKLRKKIQAHMSEYHGKTLNVSASIGVAMINNVQPGADVLLERAHKACALAKANGGNASELFIPLEDELADDEKLSIWRSRIQQALDNNRIILAYQPIVSLHGKPGEKYDVLMRMQDENGGEISPGKFLPIAEKLGLAMKMDHWVILEALKKLQGSGENTHLFIKLSAQSVSSLNLIPWLDKQLKEKGVAGDKLVFEVSEEIAFDHLKSLKGLCMGLRKLHCRIAIEHFGMTDNSSLVQKHLQAEFIKLDGQMVMQLKDKPEIRDRISTINQMAQQTQSETIAPFVEDANCLAMIWQSGVHYIQGYFVQAPDSRMNYDFSESI